MPRHRTRTVRSARHGARDGRGGRHGGGRAGPRTGASIPRLPLVRVPRGRTRLPPVPPRQRDGPRPAVRRRGLRCPGGPHLAPAGRASGDLAPRPSRGGPGRHHPVRGVDPRGARGDRLRGPGALRPGRRVRELRRRPQHDHQQQRLEVGRRHSRPGHALQRLGPPGLRRPWRDDRGHPVRLRQRAGRRDRLAGGRHADRERARPDRRPVWFRRPDDGHRLQPEQRARLGLPRGTGRGADGLRAPRRGADEPAGHPDRRLARRRRDLAGHDPREPRPGVHQPLGRPRAVADQQVQAGST